ncbi:MAG: Rieske 2Fe-2S domain-containing protein [Candidatus Acidiferrales bacterium]|jgi:nitrite reductase/ring-hydroxylating ferredoxin subunit/uncharacterized membrane protein
MRRDLTERVENAFINSNAAKRAAAPLDAWLNSCFQTTALRPLKLFLNGTWLGHPLHPLLTDVPIGAWTVTILLDLIALIFDVPGLGLAAGIATGLGVLAALATIAAGLMDWMDVDPPEKAVGLIHGILNTSATFLFAFSFLMRWESHWRPMLSSFLVALAGYVVVSGGAYLGGAMVYHMGVMINRNAYRKGPDDFLPVLGVADLLEGQPHRVEVSGQPILLLRSGERIYAIGAVCSHYGAPLEEGKIQGNTIQCPWHFSRFALADGSVCEGPACAAVPSYEVRVIKDQVEIKLWR